MNNSVILLNGLADKKIKSIGNRCLIQITKSKNILDYHIKAIHKIFKNPQIILTSCMFDSKKLKKYVENKYPNIIYIDHDVDDFTNIGTGLGLALQKVSAQNNCLILNTNHILYRSAIQKIKDNINNSFILYDQQKGSVGLLHEKNKLINCYYDLPNTLYDLLYINRKQFGAVPKDLNISKLYLFEIINGYIEKGLDFKPVKINKSSITVINSIKNIEKVKRQSCSI